MKLLLMTLLLLSSAARAELFTFEHILDDTGRNFDPGDFITMNMNSVDVHKVSMDCTGYRGAIATLYIDGKAFESKRLKTYRTTYTWDVNSYNGSKVEIKFSAIDPIVYSTKVVYEAPKEVVIETVVEIVEIEVARRNLFDVGLSIRKSLDSLLDRLMYNDKFSLFLDSGLAIAEEVVYAASNSDDSDASTITQMHAVNLVDYLDSYHSRAVLRKISKLDKRLKREVRLLRTELSLLREHLDYFKVQ